MKWWTLKRQLVGIIFFSSIALAVTGTLVYIYPRSSCFDNIKNGDEENVDCGGSCAPCLGEVRGLKRIWVRYFKIRPGVYDVAALLENINIQAGARSVRYTVTLLDARDRPIGEVRHGKTFIYPGEKIFLFEPLIDTGDKIPTSVHLTIDQIPWERMSQENPFGVNVVRKDFASVPQPIATIRFANTSLSDERNFEVSVWLEDGSGNAYAVSRTLIDVIKTGETRDAVFTWPNTPLEPPARIQVLYRRLPR